jgi:hypothetical protein
VPISRDLPQDVGNRAPSTYPGDPARAAAGPGDNRSRPSSFATILLSSQKRRPTSRSSPRVDDCPTESAAGMLELTLHGFRAEPPPRAAEPYKVRPSLRASPDQRVLVSSGTSNANARIQIGGGHLAGCEIRLAIVGSHVDAQVLTRNESSRQTLVTAMEAVRERLRARGVELRPAIGDDKHHGRDRNPKQGQPRHHAASRDNS